MSRDGWIGMLIGIAVGAAAGAAAALLYAPTSGKDLQEKIRREAERNWDDAKSGYDAKMQELRDTMDKSLGDVKSQMSRVGKKTG